MTEIQTQQIAGSFRDLKGDAESRSFTVSLSEKLVLYKNQSQIVGDETTVSLDVDGNWATELVDTDNMVGEVYYKFEINGRIYRKLVPVHSHCWDFNDLPDFTF